MAKETVRAGQPARRRESTADAIRRAAARIFLERGFTEATIADIAAKLGRPKGSIHYHIESKQDLLYDVLDFSTGVLEETAARVAAYPLPPVDRLRLVLREHLHHIVDPEYAFGSAVTEREIGNLKPEHLEDISRRRREYRALVQGLIEESVASGDLRVANTTVATRAVLSVVVQVPRWFSPSGGLDIDEMSDVLLELLLHGLAGPPKRE
ncbi:MAG: TetR family transcriptional regulator [Dehalococcoidia bacterium]|nr:TetR family transcriptional regulator [Dehalococcoidia bacterium]